MCLACRARHASNVEFLVSHGRWLPFYRCMCAPRRRRLHARWPLSICFQDTPTPRGCQRVKGAKPIAFILRFSTIRRPVPLRLPKTWGSSVDKRKPCSLSRAPFILLCWRNLLHRPLAHAVIPLVFRARAIRPMRTHPFRMVSLQSIPTLTSAVANRLMFACAARERIYLHVFYYR